MLVCKDNLFFSINAFGKAIFYYLCVVTITSTVEKSIYAIMRIFLSLILLSISALCSSAQLLYKISGNDLPRPSYVFGTHHGAPLSILDSIPSLADCFDSSQVVIGEVDLTSLQPDLLMQMAGIMKAQDGERLSQLVSREEYNKMGTSFFDLTGMHLESFEDVKPMVISNLLSAILLKEEFPETDSATQLDKTFQLRGIYDGKSVIGLETATQQAVMLFEGIPAADQAQNLKEELSDIEGLRSQLHSLNKAYFNQDIESLLRLSQEDREESEFMKKLIDDRNQTWADILPGLMQSNSCFIAVGALHLPGASGLLKILEEKGYAIYPIK